MIIQISGSPALSQGLSRETQQKLVSSPVERIEAAGQLKKHDVVMADMSKELSAEDKKLMTAAIDRDATLILQNSNSDEMKDYALVGADAEIVVVKSAYGGRRQQVIIENSEAEIIEGELETHEVTPVIDESHPDVRRERLAILAMGAEPDEETAEAEDPKAMMILTPEAEKTRRIAAWLTDDSFRNHVRPIGGGLGGQFENINASEAYASVILADRKWSPDGGKTSASYFGSVDVFVYATVNPKAKFVKISSVGSGTQCRMGTDAKYNKGFFTISGGFILYPGPKGTSMKRDIRLPQGWRRIHLQPISPNSVTTYTKTTGWSVGLEGGGEAVKDPKAAVKLSASYSEQNIESRSIPDFRVRNNSTAALCDWNYEYSAYFIDRYGMLFDSSFLRKGWVKNVAVLAYSMLPMENETVYEVPANESGVQPFTLVMSQKMARLWVSGKWSKYKQHSKSTSMGSPCEIKVNFGMVRHPG